jgi:hypothetical protein
VAPSAVEAVLAPAPVPRHCADSAVVAADGACAVLAGGAAEAVGAGANVVSDAKAAVVAAIWTARDWKRE